MLCCFSRARLCVSFCRTWQLRICEVWNNSFCTWVQLNYIYIFRASPERECLDIRSCRNCLHAFMFSFFSVTATCHVFMLHLSLLHRSHFLKYTVGYFTRWLFMTSQWGTLADINQPFLVDFIIIIIIIITIIIIISS